MVRVAKYDSESEPEIVSSKVDPDTEAEMAPRTTTATRIPRLQNPDADTEAPLLAEVPLLAEATRLPIRRLQHQEEREEGKILKTERDMLATADNISNEETQSWGHTITNIIRFMV